MKAFLLHSNFSIQSYDNDRVYKFFPLCHNFSDSIFFLALYIIKYLSIYPSLTFLISTQVSSADDSRRDSDGCYCVWSAPGWLMDWSVNGNDSTEFYAVSRTKKDGRPFRRTRDGNNAFIEMSLMKNEKSEIGPIDTKLFFSCAIENLAEMKILVRCQLSNLYYLP